jgi:hypothetical protein
MQKLRFKKAETAFRKIGGFLAVSAGASRKPIHAKERKGSVYLLPLK